MRDIRTQLVAHLHRMPLSFFTGTKTGEIMNRVSNDVDNVDNVVTGTLTSIVTNVVVIASTLVAMFVWNWRLALLSIVIVPLMVFPLGSRRDAGCTTSARRRARSATRSSRSPKRRFRSRASPSSNRSRARPTNAPASTTSGLVSCSLEIDLAMVGRWFLASVTAMVIIGPAVVWFGGGWYAIAGGLQVGVIVAFVSFIQGRLYGPAAALAGIQVQIVSALAVFERIFDYLDMTPEEYDPPDAVALTDVRGDIAFENVTFSYEPSRDVLDGISFRIAAGQAVAFVGPSGGGKTTITQLVPRFYDPQEGRVLIDGHEVRTIDAGIAAPQYRDRHARDVSLSRHDRQQSSVWEARRHRCGARRRRRGRPTSPTSLRRCPTVTRRSWASAGTSCRAESANVSRSPECCSRIRAS